MVASRWMCGPNEAVCVAVAGQPQTAELPSKPKVPPVRHSPTKGRGTEPLKGFCHCHPLASGLYQASVRVGVLVAGRGWRSEGNCSVADLGPVRPRVMHANAVDQSMPITHSAGLPEHSPLVPGPAGWLAGFTPV